MIDLGDGRDRHMSMFDPTHDPKPPVIRRVEVITGLGGRRRWSVAAKGEIMLEALSPGAVVSEVARRHDIRPQQLFGWLREARMAPEETRTFVPVVVEPAATATAAAKPKIAASGTPMAGSRSRSMG